MKALANALICNSSLTILNLRNNRQIGSKGWRALVNALTRNSTLTKLNLSYSEVNNHEIEIDIYYSLKHNQAIAKKQNFIRKANLLRTLKSNPSHVPSLLAISLFAVNKNKSPEVITALQTRLPEDLFIHLAK